MSQWLFWLQNQIICVNHELIYLVLLLFVLPYFLINLFDQSQLPLIWGHKLWVNRKNILDLSLWIFVDLFFFQIRNSLLFTLRFQKLLKVDKIWFKWWCLFDDVQLGFSKAFLSGETARLIAWIHWGFEVRQATLWSQTILHTLFHIGHFLLVGCQLHSWILSKNFLKLVEFLKARLAFENRSYQFCYNLIVI